MSIFFSVLFMRQQVANQVDYVRSDRARVVGAGTSVSFSVLFFFKFYQESSAITSIYIVTVGPL